MNCQTVQEQLIAYLDDEVTSEEQEALAAHIAGCDACQQRIADLWRVQSRLRRGLKGAAERVSAPDDVWVALSARLAVEQSPILKAESAQPDGWRGQRITGSGDPESMKRRPIFTALASLGFAAAMVAIFVYAIFIAPNRGDKDFQPAAPGGETVPLEEVVPAEEEPTAEEQPAVPFQPVAPLRWPGGLTELSTDGPEGIYVFTNPDEQTFLILVQGPAGDSAASQSALNEVMAGLDSSAMDYAVTSQSEWDLAGAHVVVLSNLPEPAVEQFKEGLASSFAPYLLESMPKDFYTMTSATGIENGWMVFEARANNDDQFIVIDERLAQPDDKIALAAGEIALLNGAYGRLTGGLSGTAIVGNGPFFDGRDVRMIGGGGGGGGGGDNPPLYPDEIAYDDGRTLVLILGDVRVEMTSNLPIEDLMAAAESLVPDFDPRLTEDSPPPQMSSMQVAPGGVYRQWSASLPVDNGLPADFYGGRSLNYYDPVGDQLVSEVRWFSDQRFIGVAFYPTFFAAMSQGEQVQVGDTLAILRQTPAQDIDPASDALTFFNGEVVPLGGGGGGGPPPEVDQIPPEDVWSVLTWLTDDHEVTVFGNVSRDELLAAAEALNVWQNWVLIHPISGGSTMLVANFTPVGLTYLPEQGLDAPVPISEGPDEWLIKFSNFFGDETFLTLRESADDGSGFTLAGDPLDVHGWSGVVQSGVSGTFEVAYGPNTVQFSYEDGTQIEVLTDSGTRIELLTNVSRDEAVKIAEGLVGPK